MTDINEIIKLIDALPDHESLVYEDTPVGRYEPSYAGTHLDTDDLKALVKTLRRAENILRLLRDANNVLAVHDGCVMADEYLKDREGEKCHQLM